MTRTRAAVDRIGASLLLFAFVLLCCSSSLLCAEGKSLLVSRAGYSLKGQPLLLDDVNVGATLNATKQQLAALQQTIQQQAALITTLKAKVDALLTPTVVQATAGDGEAEVQWAMASTTVTAQPGGQQCTTNGIGQRACKISGLSNGQSYMFTAQLTNGAGNGPVSPPSQPVTPSPQCRLLTLSTEGNGTLTATPSNSPGCPLSSFAPGTSLTLTAVPAVGCTVAQWSGSVEGPTELQWQWSYVMSNTTAQQKATFARCYALDVQLVGDGSAVTERAPEASAGCPTGYHIPGDTLVLSLTPFNSVFGGWMSPVASGANPLVYHMPAADSVLVAQVAPCNPLTVTSNGGTVIVTPSVSIGCPEGQFAGGSTISLSVTPPSPGYDFAGWRGDVNGTATSLSFVMPPAPVKLQALIRARLYYTNATFVLGQPSLTDNTQNNPAVAPFGFYAPAALAVDSAGNLFVADVYNFRILAFATDNTTAFRVIGQPDFNGLGRNRGLGAAVAAANSLAQPTALDFDAQDGLYVVDASNARVLYFPAGSDTATRVYGQNGDFTTRASSSGAGGMGAPGDVALAHDGSGIYISDNALHRVLFYPGNSTMPSRVYGQPDFDTSTYGTSATQLAMPMGLAVDRFGGLWVAELGNNRVVYFPAGSTTASRVLGQLDFVTSSAPSPQPSTTASLLNAPIAVAVDKADGLYVSSAYDNRVVYFDDGATAARYVWGQGGDLTSCTSNVDDLANPAGCTANSLNLPYSPPVVDNANRLYLADFYNNRVLRYEPL